MTTTTPQPNRAAATLHTIATWARCHLLRGDLAGACNIYANNPGACWTSLTDEDRAALGLEEGRE